MRATLHLSLVIGGLSALSAVNRPAIALKLDAASIPAGASYVCAVGSVPDRTFKAIDLEV